MQTQQLRFPCDADGYFRRECPSCEREFKIQALEQDNQPSTNEEGSKITCPYCAHRSDVGEWWTQTQVRFINKESERVVLELLGKRKSPAQMPPEVNDMKRIPITCCERDIKVLDDWQGGVYCPECGQHYP